MIDVIRSEWTKIRSVRSTVWTLAAVALLMVGSSALLSASVAGTGQVDSAAEAANISLLGVMFATLAAAALGVLVVSSEYRTGAIRVSLMAVPGRLRLLTAKILVFTGVTLAVCVLASFASVLVGAQLILGHTPWGEPEVVRATIGAALYLTASGLFGLALGTLIRHTPGAIVSAIALILVLPQLTAALPGEWGKTVHDYFTSNAGMNLVMPTQGDLLGAWSGFGVYLGWVAVTLVIGALLLRRRDA